MTLVRVTLLKAEIGEKSKVKDDQIMEGKETEREIERFENSTVKEALRA